MIITAAPPLSARSAGAIPLALALACVPEAFLSLQENAPVHTHTLRFPGAPNAAVAMSVSSVPDDEGYGRVLFADAEGLGLGWLRVNDDANTQIEYASAEDLAALTLGEGRTHTGLAAVDDTGVPEGLLRVRGLTEGEGQVPEADRLVRFRVADFSRPATADDDMSVYPWLDGLAATLEGPLASLELDGEDSELPEALATTAGGTLLIWDALGSRRADYLAARESLLVDDPQIFGDDPSEGYGLTACPDTPATAIAGGSVLASGPAAAVLVDDRVIFVGADEGPAPQTLVGAPRYDCALATLTLPGSARSLLVADLDGDGDDDLAVGSPTHAAVWVYRNLGQGAGVDLLAPPEVLTSPEGGGPQVGDFGASLAALELAQGGPFVLAVGAPTTTIEGKLRAGQVHIFDGSDGAFLRTLEDLEPRTDALLGLGVHAMGQPGRDEFAILGAREARIHWTIVDGDPRP